MVAQGLIERPSPKDIMSHIHSYYDCTVTSNSATTTTSAALLVFGVVGVAVVRYRVGFGVFSLELTNFFGESDDDGGNGDSDDDYYR